MSKHSTYRRGKVTIYVRLESGIPAILEGIDSSCKEGKYKVTKFGESVYSYHPEIHSRITEAEYNEYKPTKQPTKRSKK